ncbi:transmembrane protein 52 [Protopterus annectens]|uniref:transmembrane protein 52 n=1 Tax=Protopterus annectens TaxID=7888 RepID=UPI001CFC3B6A|nr:transmembrane protein 52 [Protopterus annectens]
MEFVIDLWKIKALLFLIHLSIAVAQNCSQTVCNQGSSSWVSMWYVWLILLAIFAFLSCGIAISCIKFCCKKKKTPAQAFPRPYEVTIISIDDESSIASSAYNSLHYPSVAHPNLPVGDMESVLVPPPPYRLYASELPPSYDEAIHMGKPTSMSVVTHAGLKSYTVPEESQPSQDLTDCQ